MEEFIEKLKERLQQSKYKGEQAIREAVVLPILQHLGWDTTDPTMVVREFTLGTRRVDYALASISGPHQKMGVFIEVKALGEGAGADRQLFEYAFHEGIPFAILTDGREWSFFLPGEQGTYDDRRVQKLDVIERTTQEIVAVLKKYLLQKRVASGDALRDARSDYQNISRKKLASAEIINAWRALVVEPDELLIDLIAEKTEAMCGYRPAAEDVEGFLISKLTVSSVVSAEKPINLKQLKNIVVEETTASDKNAALPSSNKKIDFQVLGQKKHSANATEALIDILRLLAGRNESFLQLVSERVKGASRNHIAQSREAVYPKKPDLIGYTTEILPGWWLGTNIANREKIRIIKKACEVEGLTFGTDIVISLPNAD